MLSGSWRVMLCRLYIRRQVHIGGKYNHILVTRQKQSYNFITLSNPKNWNNLYCVFILTSFSFKGTHFQMAQMIQLEAL